MKARLVLKWRTGEGGKPEAKARLANQGFRHPDALEGKSETSSPSATRTARQILSSVAARPLRASNVATAFLQGKPDIVCFA